MACVAHSMLLIFFALGWTEASPHAEYLVSTKSSLGNEIAVWKVPLPEGDLRQSTYIETCRLFGSFPVCFGRGSCAFVDSKCVSLEVMRDCNSDSFCQLLGGSDCFSPALQSLCLYGSSGLGWDDGVCLGNKRWTSGNSIQDIRYTFCASSTPLPGMQFQIANLNNKFLFEKKRIKAQNETASTQIAKLQKQMASQELELQNLFFACGFVFLGLLVWKAWGVSLHCTDLSVVRKRLCASLPFVDLSKPLLHSEVQEEDGQGAATDSIIRENNKENQDIANRENDADFADDGHKAAIPVINGNRSTECADAMQMKKKECADAIVAVATRIRGLQKTATDKTQQCLLSLRKARKCDMIKLCNGTFGKLGHDYDFLIVEGGKEEEATRIIKIQCSGVSHEEIDCEVIFNGCIVTIRRKASIGVKPSTWTQKFQFNPDDGLFEFQEDQMQLDGGYLTIVFCACPFKSRTVRFPEYSNMVDTSVSMMKSVCDDGDELTSEESFQLLIADNSQNPSTMNFDASSPKCYLPNTAFKSPDGNLLLVQNLCQGASVLMIDGSTAQVMSVMMLPSSKKTPFKLSVLATAQGTFEVSSTHRIAVPEGECLADHLKEGDEIFVGEKARKLVKVTEKLSRTDLYQLSFAPDGPVEAFQVSNWGIRTLGASLSDAQDTHAIESPTAASHIEEWMQKDQLLKVLGVANVNDADLQNVLQSSVPPENED